MRRKRYAGLVVAFLAAMAALGGGAAAADPGRPDATADRPLVADIVFARPADYHGLRLDNGTAVYTDRHFKMRRVPDALRGATYVQFANDLRTSTTVGVRLSLARPAACYLCYDARIEQPAGWIEQLGFRKTDLTMEVGANAPYDFVVFGKPVEAGTFELPPYVDSAQSLGCMIGLAFVEPAGPPPGAPPLVSQVAYALADDFHGFRCEPNVRIHYDSNYHLDQTPEAVAGGVCVPTILGGQNEAGTASMTLAAPAAVYVAMDGPPPAWLKADGFAPTDMALPVGGYSSGEGYNVRLFRRQAPAGRLELGPNRDAARRSGRSYFVIVRAAGPHDAGLVSSVYRPRKVEFPDNPRTVWCEDADQWAGTVWAGNTTVGAGFVQGPLLETTAPGSLLFAPDGQVFGVHGGVITAIRDGRQWLLAGVPEVSGHRDGPARTALFGDIAALHWHKGELIVTDRGNLCFRRLARTAAGEWRVSTIAGVPGEQGYRDGPAGAALFKQIWGAAVDAAGRIYVFDGDFLRRIAEGKVETLNPTGGHGYKDGPLAEARFSIYPGGGCCMDEHGVLFLADRINRCIRRIDLAAGVVSTYADNVQLTQYYDGPKEKAGICDSPGGIHYDPVRHCFYFSGVDEHVIRRMDATWIKTLAGLGKELAGPVKSLHFQFAGVCGIDLDGNVYTRDSAYRGLIRKLTFVGNRP